MIKTLSSYYLNIPFVSPLTSLTSTSLVLKIYVWNGLKTSAPTEATYTLTEQNPEALTTNLSVNIAKLINDFIDFTPQVIVTNYQDGNNQVWVKSEVFYNTEDASEAAIPQLIDTVFCTKGYGYAMEGVNPQLPGDNILLTNREFKVSRDSKFIVPILIDEEIIPPALTFTITDVSLDTGDTYVITYMVVGDSSNLSYSYGTYVLDDGLPVLYGFDPDLTTQTVELTESGTYDFELYAYDDNTDSLIQSNTFEITI